ncbi:MAG: hypothetical protein R2749_02290 [Acidimicrobiales bacterium]
MEDAGHRQQDEQEEAELPRHALTLTAQAASPSPVEVYSTLFKITYDRFRGCP